MKLTIKTFLGAACLALGLIGAQTTTSAVPINGSISFGGAITPQGDSGNTHPTVTDLRLATQVAFGTTIVTGVSGTFASYVVPFVTPVTMAPLLRFIAPQNVPLNPFYTVGGFTFLLQTIVVGPDPTTQTTLSLSGTGIFSGNGFDATRGSYLLQVGTAGTTFSFAANAASLPDGGTAVALLGLGLVAVEISRRLLNARVPNA